MVAVSSLAVYYIMIYVCIEIRCSIGIHRGTRKGEMVTWMSSRIVPASSEDGCGSRPPRRKFCGVKMSVSGEAGVVSGLVLLKKIQSNLARIDELLLLILLL